MGKRLPRRAGIYFCTFACWDHLHSIARTNCHDAIYEKLQRWVDKGCAVNGYVIMPNHVHLLLYVPEQLSVNDVLANCKRWWAKVILDRLTVARDTIMLERLQRDVDTSRFAKGQWFRVWEPSSDIKYCASNSMVVQKLRYIHQNPLQAHWMLARVPEEYPHSCAGQYAGGPTAGMTVTPWMAHSN
ncbi:MAG: transposase [Flavobacteriales bacterium]|nr:transposase [Flavobacteriales bacterium]